MRFLPHLNTGDFSSPEPKAQRRAYTIELEPASVCPSVRPSTLLNINSSQNSGPIAILSEASLGWGRKGCIRFWVRSDQNSGFHGNR